MSEYSENLAFIDLKAQQSAIRENLEAAITSVLDHGQYIMGPEVRDLEAELSRRTAAKHVLTCANGTDALSLVLMAWGVGPGDAVFVPAFTYVATAEASAQLGATPFFVDVDAGSFNIDPASLKQAIGEARASGLRPVAIIPVDLFGQPADFEPIKAIAEEEGLKVLIDAAQSFGATYKNRAVGALGDATTTSFFPAKPLGCYGDGGAVFTQDDETAELVNSIRLHGKGSMKYDNVRIGLNSRLDTIQAAILLEKLKIFDDELVARDKVARRYTQHLSERFDTPELISGVTSAWAQYTLRVDDRDALKEKLNKHNVPSVVYYPIALSQQLGYSQFPAVSSGLQVSEKLSGEVLSLPMHPYMSEGQQDFIIQAICA